MVSSSGAADADRPETAMRPPHRAFADFSGTLPRASSIAHWQLRDLVCCADAGVSLSSSSSSSSNASSSSSKSSSDDPYQLFVVRHCSTLRYSLRDRKVRYKSSSIGIVCDDATREERGEQKRERKRGHPSVDFEKTSQKKTPPRPKTLFSLLSLPSPRPSPSPRPP